MTNYLILSINSNKILQSSYGAITVNKRNNFQIEFDDMY